MSGPNQRFVRACAVADVPDDTGLGVVVEGHEVALFRVDGRLHAVEDLCTHAGAKISEGPLEGSCVTCPWHFARYDVTTGEPCGGPAFTPVDVYAVRVEGGEVFIGLPAGS